MSKSLAKLLNVLGLFEIKDKENKVTANTVIPSNRMNPEPFIGISPELEQAIAESKVVVPKEFLWENKFMTDPVKTVDGATYPYEFAVQLVNQPSPVISPKTGLRLTILNLEPDTELLRKMNQWIEEQTALLKNSPQP